MKATSIDFRSIGQWIILLAVASLATLLIAQKQEIDRLDSIIEAQSLVIQSQQQWAVQAASHLEILHKYEIPYRYLEVLAEASSQFDLDLEFMVGLMQVESAFNPNAISDKNAYGLMQVRFPTAREIDPSLQSYWQLFDPERNIRLGVIYFSNLLERYDGDYRIASEAYNRGPTRLDGDLQENMDISDHYYRRIRAAGIVDN
jgi:soluble lytic murein transglycosylase